ncbi:hypothetical protein CPB85DRAFT_1428177 [Mucidula mucida]|nr:hypothetical protein CPB85DRAFT_1428177 [Mucidula mucida]
MLTPTPLRSFVGGLGLPLPMHALVVLNGSVFGISGFLHRTVRGDLEAFAGVAGLVVGGLITGLLDGPPTARYNPGTLQLLLSGFLVGLGSKMANGCTSGHMLAGIGRLSRRSFAAVASFFTTGMITAHIFHSHNPLFTSSPFDLEWTNGLGRSSAILLSLQIISMLISYFQYAASLWSTSSREKQQLLQRSRMISIFNTSVQFALSLSLSNLTDNRKVISFLQLPSLTFDPSLAFLALGALPLAIVLHAVFSPSDDVPVLGGPWRIPKSGLIDAKLLCGAAIFGVGWALSGICHGPGLVNLGRSLASGTDILPWSAWIAATVIGGLFA